MIVMIKVFYFFMFLVLVFCCIKSAAFICSIKEHLDVIGWILFVSMEILMILATIAMGIFMVNVIKAIEMISLLGL